MRWYSPCFFCGALSGSGFCDACEKELERTAEIKAHTLLFCEGAMTVFPYASDEVRRMIFAVKRRGLKLVTDRLCRELVRAYPAFGVPFSAVTYVPRRKTEKARSGGDQAKLLARRFSVLTGIPCVRLLARRGFSRRQHGLTRQERRENVRGKFSSRGRMPRGNILLIDDIITTGATCEEAAKTLLAAGAEAVLVLAPARGGVL